MATASGSRTGGMLEEEGGERASENQVRNWVRGFGSRWDRRRGGEEYWLWVVRDNLVSLSLSFGGGGGGDWDWDGGFVEGCGGRD